MARGGGVEPGTCLLPLSYLRRDRGFPSWHLSCLFPFRLQDSQVHKMLSFPTLLMRLASSGKKRDVWPLTDPLDRCLSLAPHASLERMRASVQPARGRPPPKCGSPLRQWHLVLQCQVEAGHCGDRGSGTAAACRAAFRFCQKSKHPFFSTGS